MTLPVYMPGTTVSVKVSQVVPSAQPASPSSGSVLAVAPPVAVPVHFPSIGVTGPVGPTVPEDGLAAFTVLTPRSCGDMKSSTAETQTTSDASSRRRGLMPEVKLSRVIPVLRPSLTLFPSRDKRWGLPFNESEDSSPLNLI